MAVCSVESRQDCRVLRVGLEKTPVLVWDDFSRHLEDIRAWARYRARFSQDEESSYPGLRSVLPQAFASALMAPIEPALRELYAVPGELSLRFVYQYLSLLTRAPEELAVLQRLPHFDSPDHHSFALLLYINPGEFGGTGFFRHKPSGYEVIDGRRKKAFISQAERYMDQFGLPRAAYINDSTDHFELVERVDYRPNRLLAYPGNLLHSGLIEPERDINSDPASGRLTVNLFVRFEPSV